MRRLHVNSFMGNVCTVTSHCNIHNKLLFMISLFSQESVDDVHHLPRVIYCGYYGHVHAKCCWVSLSIADAFYVSTIEPTSV